MGRKGAYEGYMVDCSIGDSFVFGFAGLAREFLFCVRGTSGLLTDFVSGIGIADASFVLAIFLERDTRD